jgi:galactose mutarotase-like enzyme
MVGERIEEGFAALTLESEALGGVEAIFVPEAGMVCCGLRHRGEELLGQRGGLTRYVEAGSTMGIPFLHPWANRLAEHRFELAGWEVDLELEGLHVKRSPDQPPPSSRPTASRRWSKIRAKSRRTSSRSASSPSGPNGIEYRTRSRMIVAPGPSSSNACVCSHDA